MIFKSFCETEVYPQTGHFNREHDDQSSNLGLSVKPLRI